MKKERRRKILFGLCAAIVALTTVAAYFPGLWGPFVFDDYPNLVKNSRVQIDSLAIDSLWSAALSGESGPLNRPISMATFAVNYALTGDDTFAFKVTNLGIHLLNGLLLALVIVQLIRQSRARARLTPHQTAWLALLVTAVWLLHPINLTSVLYVVQRMTSLSATFTLMGLLFYLIGRSRLPDSKLAGSSIMVASTIGFTALATLCKENGALLILYLWVAELFLLAVPAGINPSAHKRLLFLATTGLAAGALVLSVAYGDRFLSGYDHRSFTVTERLLTQSRALVWYSKQIIVPQIGQFSLMHDNFPISRSLTEPLTTLWSLLTLVLAAGVALALRHRVPIVTFGVFWFLAGHVLESTIIPLEMVYEHRNYLPAVGLILPIAWGAVKLPGLLPSVKPSFAIALVATWPLVFGIVTFTRSAGWQDTLTWSLYQVQHNPDSPRNHFFLGSLFASWAPRTNDPFKMAEYYYRANDHFNKAQSLSPDHMPGAIVARIRLASTFGKEIEDERVEKLVGLLSEGSISASTRNAIGDLTDCMIEDKCTLTDAQYLSIHNAVLDNPDIPLGARLDLFASLSDYYAHKRDYGSAIRFAEQATFSGRFRSEYAFLLARRLVEAGQLSQALKVLEEIEQRDRLNAYGVQLEKWRAKIETLSEPADGT